MSTNSEVVHAWANQKDKRSNHLTSQLGNLISYSTTIARWYETPSGPLAVVSSRKYSATTTGKHSIHIPRALQGSRYIRVDLHIDNLPYQWEFAKTAIYDKLKEVLEASILEVKTCRTNRQIKLAFVESNAQHMLNFCTEYSIDISDDERLLLNQAVQNPRAFILVQDPTFGEKLEKDRIKADKRAASEEKKRQAERTKAVENLSKWRHGEYHAQIYSLPVALRINGDRVETSYGASIFLDTAKRLFAALLAREIEQGYSVDHYSVRSISESTITIGCHEIAMSEIYMIANQLGLLTPVTDSVNLAN